ncbi:hypothetical protein C489_18901 [Natrinema versiforme JCM 10478]|uniref:Uncharacterized protein n=1 Tax=Natrinema versiforme JCM 10478 TaxID=1227496 RepID=L9XQ25_9EURY|nr:hypothetical protein C489_18901 [Natrinema versiforme JCM 10478]
MFQITVGWYLYAWKSGGYRRAVMSSFIGFLSDLLARFTRSLRSEAPPRIMLNAGVMNISLSEDFNRAIKTEQAPRKIDEQLTYQF